MEIDEWVYEAQCRADAATAGPWQVYDRGVGFLITTPGGDPLPEGDRTDLGRKQDAEFIAAARTDLPRALEALRSVLHLCDAEEASPSGRGEVTVGDIRMAILDGLNE